MTVEIAIDESELVNLVTNEFDKIRVPVQDAMAERFEIMVKQNIGSQDGDYRPTEWSPLSKGYAKRVGRPYATLKLTGELENSIARESSSDEASVVCSISYAAEHQYGEGKLPARPFFPIMSGEFTDIAVEQCVDAAKVKLQELLNGSA